MRLHSLKGRLRIALVALAVLPLLIVGLAISVRTYTSQQNQVIELQEEVSQRISTDIQSFVETRVAELMIASQISGLPTRDVDEQRDFLIELLSYQPAFDGLTLIDSTGEEVVRVSRLSVVTQQDLDNRSEAHEFIVPYETGEIFVGSPEVDTATAQLISTIGIPIIEPRTGNTSYVLLAEVRLSFLSNRLSDVQDSTAAYLLNGEGRIVAHPNSSIVLGETYYDVPSQPQVTRGLSGEESVVAFTRIPISDDELVVVAEQPVSVALSLVRTTVVVLGIAIFVTFIVALLLAALGTRFIIRPLQELASVAEKIQHGDLSQRAQVRGSDEIGGLARSFNAMTDQLSQLIGNLEQRVSERTRDLEVAADVSRQVATELELNQLLLQLVERTRSGFDLYHVSVFLYQSATKTLNYRAGTGEAGDQMLAAGKQFNLHTPQSLVVQAARIRQPVLANDVKSDPNYFSNPYLPDTASELVVPMIVGDKLVGVLDLQSNQLNRFTSDDLRVITSLAEQLAVAVENAQLYAKQSELIDELRVADQMKSQFLASMSHELRTPLNSILTFTELIAMGTFGDVNDEQKEYLEKSLFSGRHLLALINDVLDITKIQSGMMKLFVEEDFNIYKEVDHIQAAAEKLLGNKPVKLVMDIDRELPILTVDKRRIRQVLLNIVSNAVKFTEEGTITLSIKKRTDEILFAIIDTGPGISSDQHEIIFEPFMQTETGIKHAGGTGLGLPISKRLVELHGGRLWLESTLGQGAAFYIKLPIAPIVTVGEIAMKA